MSWITTILFGLPNLGLSKLWLVQRRRPCDGHVAPRVNAVGTKRVMFERMRLKPYFKSSGMRVQATVLHFQRWTRHRARRNAILNI